MTKDDVRSRVRHVAYAGGWKKFEPLWDLLIRSRHVLHALPLLEANLAAGRNRAEKVGGTAKISEPMATTPLRMLVATDDSLSSGKAKIPPVGGVQLVVRPGYDDRRWLLE